MLSRLVECPNCRSRFEGRRVKACSDECRTALRRAVQQRAYAKLKKARPTKRVPALPIDERARRGSARWAVAYAIKTGRLVRGPCEKRGAGGCSGPVEAHHDDYDKPLEVRWMCKRHHAKADGRKMARFVAPAGVSKTERIRNAKNQSPETIAGAGEGARSNSLSFNTLP